MGQAGQPQGRSILKRVGNILYGADEPVARWVAERIEGAVFNKESRAIGILDGNNIVAGVVYENHNGVHVEASIAARAAVNWANRRVLHAIFHYPFVTLNCEAISVSVAASNLASLNFVTKLGFAPEAIIRLAAHDRSDLIVLKAWRNQCRWIGHGQGQKQSTSGTRPDGDGSRGGAIQPR